MPPSERVPASSAAVSSPPPDATHPTPKAVPLRIRHLDSLRAVAACLVVWSHFAPFMGPVSGPDPAILRFLQGVPHALNIGRVGVIIFFAVSGFVICRSFSGPREGGARRFLIKRFCRLYPAFWVSMLSGILVWWASGDALTWPVLWANATMLPMRLGQTPLVGVYWTLEFELLFYALCLGLYLARGLHRRWVLSTCVLALAALPRVMKIVSRGTGMDLQIGAEKYNLVACLAVMFWGATFRLVYDETGGFREKPLRRWCVWQLILLTVALVDLTDPHVKWTLLGLYHGRTPAYFLEMSSMLIFAVWVACLRIDNAVVTRIGVISYSLYLFHPLPMSFVRLLLESNRMIQGWALPFWFYFLAAFIVALALSEGVYRWVERPAIALGKRWTSLS